MKANKIADGGPTMNEALFKSLSTSAQAFLRAVADTPEQTAAIYNGLASFRGALRVGNEVIEKGSSAKTQGERDKIASCLATNLAVCSAIECFMSLLENLHPETDRRKNQPPPGDSTTGKKEDLDQTIERFKRLDLDT